MEKMFKSQYIYQKAINKSMIICLLLLSNVAFCQLYEYNKEKNIFTCYLFNSKSKGYTNNERTGKIAVKNNKNYLKFDEKIFFIYDNMKGEYIGFYIEDNCIDEKLDSILFNEKWLQVNDNINLVYSDNQLEIICYAGKSTIDEGFYKFSAKRFEKLTTGSKKSITLPIEKKVTVKRNCQKVYEGENINILISSMNGLIKLNFNKIPGQIK